MHLLEAVATLRLMYFKQVEISLPEGEYKIKGQFFEESDIEIFTELFVKWIELSNKLKEFGGRGINLPEVLSESLFAYAMGDCIRPASNVTGYNSSFDVYNLKTKKRIQVKACSILPDLTSFGPKSIWDEIYFMTFPNTLKDENEINIYKIPNELIYEFKINKNQTMREQQLQGRRPRFSIMDSIIKVNRIKPIKTIRIYNNGI